MASITSGPNGTKIVQFATRKNGPRRSIRLGKVSMKIAQEVKRKVETIQGAAEMQVSLDVETARWLSGIGDDLHAKLATVGLVQPRDGTRPRSVLLGEFLEGYIAKRMDKPNTRKNLVAAKQRLVSYFGADRDLRTITRGDADGFELYLRKEGYAKATVSRSVRFAKQYFRAAARAEVIERDPFEDIEAGGQTNEERKHFIPREVAQAVIDACPDHEWKLIFALSRFGGLRCPSEHLGMTWADVDWARDRFRVRSPKTEHHEGKAFRWVPIFPELRPHLQAAWDAAPEGALHVITRYRDTNANLRTQLLRIIDRAGVRPWPKLFQNLRATRETELAAMHPIHVVCNWIGNDVAVAAKHYLQTTEEDFRRAVGALQKAVQHPLTHDDTGSRPEKETPEKSGFSEPMAACASGYHGESYARRDSNSQPADP